MKRSYTQQPRPRLRRLKGLLLKNLVVPVPGPSFYSTDRTVGYQLYQVDDGCERLLYQSEQASTHP